MLVSELCYYDNLTLLNCDNCQAASFSRKGELSFALYGVRNKEITVVATVKNLGILHDSKLAFALHIVALISYEKLIDPSIV